MCDVVGVVCVVAVHLWWCVVSFTLLSLSGLRCIVR